MMEDLGLSLSFNLPPAVQDNRTSDSSLPPAVSKSRTSDSSPIHFNLMPSFNFLRTTSDFANNSLNFSSDRGNGDALRAEARSFLKGIDVNRMPSAVAEAAEEEAGVSSPNSTVSSVSGKRNERDVVADDHDGERASSRGVSDEDDGDNCRKKLRLSKDQSAVLEESFKEHHTLNPKQKLALAKSLGLRPRQVEVWFQNRRARTKLKQTEVDCELLKKCCEDLSEDNKRLHKELQELRALKLSPNFYMHMTPPTTLTMCPSCEHVAVPPSSDTRPRLTGPHENHHRKLPFNPWAH